MVAAAATCAALYAIVNILTSPIRTPWGVGEFRPGVVIPAFYALIFGPVPAAVGAGLGSFIGDMVSLVATGGSNPLLALVAGGVGNFLGFLVLGWVYEKIKGWKGFVAGTTSGLFVGNLWAAGGVVFLLHLPLDLILGFLLFWFGTMFPFVIILVPGLIRAMRPYASKLSVNSAYPELVEPQKKVLWTWTLAVSGLVLASLLVFLFFQTSFSSSFSVYWISILLAVSAISVVVVGAFIPTHRKEEQVPVVSS
jgi:ECF-type riboflavin transporter, S component